MKHYDYVEWIFYKNKQLSNSKMEEMEDHLYNCHTCMDIFLSLIDEEEIQSRTPIVPKDFKTKIIDKISKTKVVDIETRTKRLFTNKFGYYVAVASFTIILTLGGFYTNLVDAVPRIQENMQVERKTPNFIGDFSEKIINSTSKVLSSIENRRIDHERQE